MRNYELMLIVRPDLEKEVYEEIKGKVSSLFSQEKGVLKSWQIWKERYRLSYPLKLRGAERKKFNEGTYLLCEFTLNPQKLGVLKYTLDLDERIIRYLIINKGD